MESRRSRPDLSVTIGPIATIRAQLTFLPDRTPAGVDEDSADAFKRLAGYRDGAIFVGHWQIVMVVDGSTTISFSTVRPSTRPRCGRANWWLYRRAPGTDSRLPRRSRSSALHHNRPTTGPNVPADKPVSAFVDDLGQAVAELFGRTAVVVEEQHEQVLGGRVVLHVGGEAGDRPAVCRRRAARAKPSDRRAGLVGAK